VPPEPPVPLADVLVAVAIPPAPPVDAAVAVVVAAPPVPLLLLLPPVPSIRPRSIVEMSSQPMAVAAPVRRRVRTMRLVLIMSGVP
jgi:hypothetical protein